MFFDRLVHSPCFSKPPCFGAQLNGENFTLSPGSKALRSAQTLPCGLPQKSVDPQNRLQCAPAPASSPIPISSLLRLGLPVREACSLSGGRPLLKSLKIGRHSRRAKRCRDPVDNEAVPIESPLHLTSVREREGEGEEGERGVCVVPHSAVIYLSRGQRQATLLTAQMICNPPADF